MQAAAYRHEPVNVARVEDVPRTIQVPVQGDEGVTAMAGLQTAAVYVGALRRSLLCRRASPWHV